MCKIKAILFDMDGVLIEAKDWHYDALNKALRLFGMEISRIEHLTTFDGLPTKDKLKMLSLERGLPMGLHGFINELKQQYTMDLVYSLCKPRFHHEYALSKLKENGYKMAVCSNSIRNTIEIMMQKASLDVYLDFYISNEDVEKGKPDPEMYNKAIEKMNLHPKECMIIEDNENGIKAARASGANVMIVEEITEVNYENILRHINNFQKENR
ncbi:HAD family phosphatase [Campylobacter lari]|uniref:HAD family hydrolase n=1 Tax=Campylobacter sp. CNRCH_2014_2452 TaxID=2911603 RepID=UPI001272D950|nr:HAD family phosphatase [Campylobacter sp. CNRCH_2014_2452]EAK0818251.1 HAD family phosphatase [Campylobacter lari]EAK9890881.1 HAD family phosphatase [Campylobacter lari]EGK8025295.1 HAD family phosphatase [Campylobacter lari]EGK8037556.1 HAD family phosphatase [Campylobacter lari]EGK8129340.1 HAD family phosphatase [Campylobacter lari]